MAGWTIALMFQAVVTTTPPAAVSYEEAYTKSVETGRPLVVLVGADWCKACVDLKKRTMGELKKDGVLDDVVYTVVDKDERGKLASQLMRGNSMPQLLVFHKSDTGWRKQHMVGVLTENAVRSAIDTAVQTTTVHTRRVLRAPVEKLE